MLLGRLTPFDLETLGVDGGVGDLRGLVFKDVPVLPTPSRPTGRMRSDNPAPHSYSMTYNKIVHSSNMMLKCEGEALRKKRADAGATTLGALLWNAPLKRRFQPRHVQKWHDVAVKSIGESLGRKKGSLRGNVLGKRSFGCARTNVTPDPWLPMDQVRECDKLPWLNQSASTDKFLNSARLQSPSLWRI